MTKQKFTVRILDNFRFMDKAAEYNSGSFDTYEEAVTKCKRIIDEFLDTSYQPGDSTDQLYGTYVHYGETPLIWGETSGDFDPNAYAKMRCMEICMPSQPRIKKFIRDIDNE